jgi:hypothetical protein
VDPAALGRVFCSNQLSQPLYCFSFRLLLILFTSLALFITVFLAGSPGGFDTHRSQNRESSKIMVRTSSRDGQKSAWLRLQFARGPSEVPRTFDPLPTLPAASNRKIYIRDKNAVA